MTRPGIKLATSCTQSEHCTSTPLRRSNNLKEDLRNIPVKFGQDFIWSLKIILLLFWCLRVAVFLKNYVEGHWMNISTNLFWNQTSTFMRMEFQRFKDLSFWPHAAMFFYSFNGDWTPLVEHHPRKFLPTYLGRRQADSGYFFLIFRHFAPILMLLSCNVFYHSI